MHEDGGMGSRVPMAVNRMVRPSILRLTSPLRDKRSSTVATVVYAVSGQHVCHIVSS